MKFISIILSCTLFIPTVYSQCPLAVTNEGQILHLQGKTMKNSTNILANKGKISKNKTKINILNKKLNTLKKINTQGNKDRLDGNKDRLDGNKKREAILKHMDDDLQYRLSVNKEITKLSMYKSLQEKHHIISKIYNNNVSEILASDQLSTDKKKMIASGFAALKKEAEYLQEELKIITNPNKLQLTDADRMLLLKNNYAQFNEVVTLIQYWAARGYKAIENQKIITDEKESFQILLSNQDY